MWEPARLFTGFPTSDMNKTYTLAPSSDHSKSRHRRDGRNAISNRIRPLETRPRTAPDLPDSPIDRTRTTSASPAPAGRSAGHHDLFAVRGGTPYTPAERAYSHMVQSRLEQLLQAECRELVLLRRYHDGSDRISVLTSKTGMQKSGLRREMVERILTATLGFVRDGSAGGPISQSETREGVLETQFFGTRYPHIVIERVDAFSNGALEPLYTEWRLRRTQNQKAETQINRWMDAAGLGMNVLKAVAGVV